MRVRAAGPGQLRSLGVFDEPVLLTRRGWTLGAPGSAISPCSRTGSIPPLSNLPWVGQATAVNSHSKRAALSEHSVLLLTRRLLDARPDSWSDEDIKARTNELAVQVIRVWQRPQQAL